MSNDASTGTTPTIAIMTSTPNEAQDDAAAFDETTSIQTNNTNNNSEPLPPSSPANTNNPPTNANIQRRESQPWQCDDTAYHCSDQTCRKPFHPLHRRRHHCRLCGNIFCRDCSSKRCLIPPSFIVLTPRGGKKVTSFERRYGAGFGEGEADPDRTVTYARQVEVSIPSRSSGSSSEEGEDNVYENGAGDPDELMAQQLNRAGLRSRKNGSKPKGSTIYTSIKDLRPPSPEKLPDKEEEDEDEEEEVQFYVDPSYPTSNDPNSPPPALVPPPPQTPQTLQEEVLLYGKGLEERAKLARRPLRVCRRCHSQLAALQDSLRASNSNAVRFNAVDPTNIRRLLNSPLAFTLGHEVRKAAYTLGNLLPLPRQLSDVGVGNGDGGAFGFGFKDSIRSFMEDASSPGMDGGGLFQSGIFARSLGASSHGAGGNSNSLGVKCWHDNINMGDLDGVRIPARLLERAKGIAILTVAKGGLGVTGFEFGTGLVLTRVPNSPTGWSAPCAIGTAGISCGALVGAQLTDHIFLLMNDDAIEVMSSNDGSVQLGVDIGVSIGPVGRTLEADLGAAEMYRKGDDDDDTADESATATLAGAGMALAPIYTYSYSKGLYAGVSFDGKIVVTRHGVNEIFYGKKVHPKTLLSGEEPPPPAGRPLYDALRRCAVYAGDFSSFSRSFGRSGNRDRVDSLGFDAGYRGTYIEMRREDTYLL